jgi:RNA polymerase sigma-70 factor, ECF subfamily
VDTGWEEIYHAQYRRLVALVAAVCGSRLEAEEAVQEAFLRAIGLTGRRPVVDDPAAWLYRVAVNVIRSRWRRALVARRVNGRLAADPDLQDVRGSDDATDERLVLLAALRKLPFARREALALHYLADLTVEAIAVRTQAPLGTVKTRLARGRAALAGILAERVGEGTHHV